MRRGRGLQDTRLTSHIDKHCSTCDKIETDAHLFFHCDFARAVWFSSDPPLRSDNLPDEDDGVQIILSTFITTSVSDYLLQKILTTMWYIWKARNHTRFARKNWTPWQVHHAVAAHISVANSVATAGDEQAGHIQPLTTQDEGAVTANAETVLTARC